MDRISLRPEPLSYRELAEGALYNAAQPRRQERKEYRGPDPNQSLEHIYSHDDSRGSFADLSAGHLYNPTSSAHEVDPPTWPAHGMENVGTNASPFRSYRLERPPSPVLAKRYTTTYQGRGPSHHTVASGALFNPYVRGRLPGDLDTDSARLFADSSYELSRSMSQVNHVYQATPKTSVPLKEKPEPSAFGHGRDNKDDDNSSNYSVSLGSFHTQENLGAGGASRRSSIRSTASHLPTANPHTAQAGPAIYMHPSQSRSRTDDSIYYHPSREGTPHRTASLSHAHQNTAHPLTGHARTASVSQGSMSSLGTATVSRHTPWMQQENMHAAAFDSVHPSRAHSPADDAVHYHPSRAPSSLHRSYGDPGAWGSAHPSRAPSHHGSASLRPAFGDAPFPASAHPSRAPTVIRDSVAIQEGQWGDGAPGDLPPDHIPSRAPTASKGSIRAAGSARNFQTSRTPSAATHVARFHEQQTAEMYPKTSRSPSAASRASQIQRHMGGGSGGGSRMGTPAPIHEEWGTAQEHFEHFEQDRGASPVVVRTASAADDAVSSRSRVTSEAHGTASRAGSAVGMAPSPHGATVARRGRASKLRKGSARAASVAAPEPPGSASVYRISVVDPTDDGRSPIS